MTRWLSGAARAALFLFALAAAPALLPAATAVAAPQIDAPAPIFRGATAAGETIALDQFRGKTVVLEWTNHDCPFVRKHYRSGNMQALQARAAAEDVVWISVISSAPGLQGHVDGATALRLNEERGAAPAHVILDESGEIGRLYNAVTTPHMYVVDAEGLLAFRGGIDDIPSADTADVELATNYVTEALDALASSERPETRTARPYGCSVKYGG